MIERLVPIYQHSYDRNNHAAILDYGTEEEIAAKINEIIDHINSIDAHGHKKEQI